MANTCSRLVDIPGVNAIRVAMNVSVIQTIAALQSARNSEIPLPIEWAMANGPRADGYNPDQLS